MYNEKLQRRELKLTSSLPRSFSVESQGLRSLVMYFVSNFNLSTFVEPGAPASLMFLAEKMKHPIHFRSRKIKKTKCRKYGEVSLYEVQIRESKF